MAKDDISNQSLWKERIVYDDAILAGKPVIKGTRIAVEFVIDLLAQGWTEPDPGLKAEDIRACLAYARDILHSERVYPIGA